MSDRNLRNALRAFAINPEDSNAAFKLARCASRVHGNPEGDVEPCPDCVETASNSLTHQEYWDEVRRIGADALEETEGDDDAMSNYVWETVDGHQWVIYTRMNYYVMLHTDNADAWQEFGELDPDKAIAQMAFSAMCQDVNDRLPEPRECTECNVRWSEIWHAQDDDDDEPWLCSECFGATAYDPDAVLPVQAEGE